MKIQELYKKRDAWGKGDYGIDEDGVAYDAENCRDLNNETLVCFCLAGAVHRCYSDSDLERKVVFGKLAEGIKAKYPTYRPNSTDDEALVIQWNDVKERTIRQVRDLVATVDV